jgi:hypothetical protein
LESFGVRLKAVVGFTLPGKGVTDGMKSGISVAGASVGVGGAVLRLHATSNNATSINQPNLLPCMEASLRYKTLQRTLYKNVGQAAMLLT